MDAAKERGQTLDLNCVGKELSFPAWIKCFPVVGREAVKTSQWDICCSCSEVDAKTCTYVNKRKTVQSEKRVTTATSNLPTQEVFIHSFGVLQQWYEFVVTFIQLYKEVKRVTCSNGYSTKTGLKLWAKCLKVDLRAWITHARQDCAVCEKHARLPRSVCVCACIFIYIFDFIFEDKNGRRITQEQPYSKRRNWRETRRQHLLSTWSSTRVSRSWSTSFAYFWGQSRKCLTLPFSSDTSTSALKRK